MPKQKSRIEYIDPKLIAPSAVSPRTTYDKKSIKDLAKAIKLDGDVTVAIQVEHVGGKEKPYAVIGGERRRRAVELAGLTSVKVEVLEFEHSGLEGMLERSQVAWNENIQRENLHDLDKAEYLFLNLLDRTTLSAENLIKILNQTKFHIENKSLKKLLDGETGGATYANTVKKILEAFDSYSWKKLPTYVRNYLPIVSMDKDIRDAYRTNLIGRTDVFELNRITSEKTRRELITALEKGKLKRKDLLQKINETLGESRVSTVSFERRLKSIETRSKKAKFRGEKRRQFETARQEFEIAKQSLEQKISQLERFLT